MTNKPFDRPITVDDPDVGRIEIASVREAMDYLSAVEWPFEDLLEKAINTAEAALQGTCSASDARAAFLKAARAADVVIFD
jgi:hypothetical protein